ncbi:hypothetical protein [Mycobacterium antarcticum]|uniref:hypothetical protein n=1 Tax=Mycolicibacterium sp. TUM20984 TaxID=3023368 RepID=UPI002395ACCD|nr:hypothetical protein [Mycolicibacterium sp. TUM20984]GLP83576.1 hypothetical protein TUM20984_49960 [Mycolicibacterium sp. TUM20984]
MGLSNQERFACAVAERITGAVAEEWDVDGRQGAFDAILTYPDGRRAAFEVTSLSADGAIQTQRLLGRDNYSWPLPGKWWWTISVGSPRDIPRLREAYQKIILLCEQANAERPEQLSWWSDTADADGKWLVTESSSTMIGHRNLSASKAPGGGAMVVPTGDGGAADISLSGLRDALNDAFNAGHMPAHIRKVCEATHTDERHLFIAVHDTALPFPVMYGLMFGDALPPEPPPLPAEIHTLWLALPYTKRLMTWSRTAGWTNHYPYREPDE